MVSLEQVKLLESKVTKAIDYLKKLTEEKMQLTEKLDSYQKRIDELEVLVQRFKDDQNRIEDGILSALDRLNQFEDALETRLSGKTNSANNLNKKEIPPRQDAEVNVTPEQSGRLNGNGGNTVTPPKQIKEEDSSPEGGELDIF
ncbi:MAG: cell division protein ZapB [Treponema sp.]|nr:cell division protein ZapB [Treponema sp.]